MGRFNVGRLRINPNDPKRAGGIQSAREGMRAIIANFNKLCNNLQELSVEAVYRNGVRVLERGQYYVPKDTWALHNSGYAVATDVGKVPGSRVNVQVGFGKGDKPDYAVIVHENLESRHAAPTQAKYLQQAITDVVGSMLQEAANTVGEPFGK